jgi:hypothetical protein
MSLSVGIVGLPNVGKSTLFNALLKKQLAYVANFPFATIEPNIGVVPVPDARLAKLAEVVKNSEKLDHLPPEVPAVVQFVDIAGLIAGAHKGEGLGNKFLSHIRETDAVCHVVRVFTDPDIVKEGSVNPREDFEVIETELMMADLQTLEKQQEPKMNATREEKIRWEVVKKFRQAIEKGTAARAVSLTEEEQKEARQLSLLTMKPILVALNCDESDLKNADELEKKYAIELGLEDQASLTEDAQSRRVIAISARTEEQLAGFTEEEQKDYLKDLGIEKIGLERLIKKGFATLNLITFLTAGEKEVRAWTIKRGITALEASGVIHTDFMQKFIKADVVTFDDFINNHGWRTCRENGLVRSEGKDYIVQDGEVIEFKIGT